MGLHLFRTPKVIHKCTNFGIACRAHHKLFVKGLPQDITEEKLHIQCKEAGRVSDIRLFPDESKTNAYVWFETSSDMHQAAESLRNIAESVSPMQSIRRPTSKPAPLISKQDEKKILDTSSTNKLLKKTKEKCSSYITSSKDETLAETKFISLPKKDQLARNEADSPSRVFSSNNHTKVSYCEGVTMYEEEPFPRKRRSKSFQSRMAAAAAAQPVLPRKNDDSVWPSTSNSNSRNNIVIPAESSIRQPPKRFSNNIDLVNNHEQPDLRPAETEDEYCLLFQNMRLDTPDEYFEKLYHRFRIGIYRDEDKENRTLNAYVSFDSKDSLDTASKDKNAPINGGVAPKQSFVPKCLQLFVYGLCPMTDDPVIRKYFAKFGRCEVEIVKDPQLNQKTKSKQMQQSRTKNAIVVFSRPEEVLSAMSYNEPHFIDGHLVSIHPCNSLKRTLIVSGISLPDVSISSLKEYFSKFGPVLNCEALRDPNFQHCAYVTFFNASATDKAMATIPHIINGHTCDTIRYRYDWKTKPMSQKSSEKIHKEGEKERETNQKKSIRTGIVYCTVAVLVMSIIYVVYDTDSIQNACIAEPKATEDSVWPSTSNSNSRNNIVIPAESSIRQPPKRFSNNIDLVNNHEQPDLRPAETEDEYCLLFQNMRLDTPDEYFEKLYHRFRIGIYRDEDKENRTLNAYVSFDSKDSLDTASKDKNAPINGGVAPKQSFVPKCLQLFVYGLCPMTDDPVIRKYFAKFGRCEVEIVKDPQLNQKTKSKQMQQSRTKNAIVVFSRPEEVLSAMSYNEPHFIDGHLVSIHPCNSLKRTLIVSGISLPDVSISSLKEYFSKFGPVLNCEALRDPNFQHCAYVTFFNASATDKAMATIPHIINGHTCDTIRYRYDWKTKPMSQKSSEKIHKEGEKERETNQKKSIRTGIVYCTVAVLVMSIIYVVYDTDSIQNACIAEPKATEDVHHRNRKNIP
ncbi:RNA recognition motif domain-containing protein [Ditylenchus destructor]|uniref:RNA recognition motif domain-containing protein n=1 Tax=Ditylenchus destructor TaxID=166010 RepID=A0AAD4MV97_9BILA|nr:RNA recognition motif domain-containing protein [Ditylenchus destructor]